MLFFLKYVLFYQHLLIRIRSNQGKKIYQDEKNARRDCIVAPSLPSYTYFTNLLAYIKIHHEKWSV